MRLVLDATAAVSTALGRGAPRSAKALEDADEVLAPDLLVAEVTNTIWKYHQFENLSLDVCDRALQFALADAASAGCAGGERYLSGNRALGFQPG